MFQGNGECSSRVLRRSAKRYFYRAYNDMLFLCEKYGPLEGLEMYDPEKDISVTGDYVPFCNRAVKRVKRSGPPTF
jgi:hypothetical protein